MPSDEIQDSGILPPKISTRRSSFFKAVTFTSTGTIVNIAFLFIETMIIARQLDTASYGIYALMIILVNFLVMLIDFGSVTAIVQLIASSENDRQNQFASTAILFRVLTIGAFSVLILIGRDALILVDPSKAIEVYTVYLPLMLLAMGMDELLIAVLQGKQLYRQMAIAMILRSCFRLGLTASFFFILKLGFMAPIYSWILSYAVSVSYEFLVLPFSKRLSFHWPLLKNILRFGFPLQLNNFLWFASNSSQSLLLNVLIGPSAVAFYEVAQRIPNAIIRFSQAYTAVYFPTLTSLLADGKRGQSRKLLEHSLSLMSFFMAVIALVSIVFNHEIVTILFSEKYAESGITFALLMIAIHMTVLVTLMGYTMVSVGFPSRSLISNAVREGLMFLTNLAIIPVAGFVGPAYSKVVAFYVANPLSVWLLRKSDFRFSVAPYVKQTVFLWMSAAFFWLVKPENIFLRLLIILAFFAINLLFSTISVDDLNLILPDVIKKRFSRRVEADAGIQVD